MTNEHRKLVKHWEHAGHVRELTFSCYRRLPLLTNDAWREGLSMAINAAVKRHSWSLAAFVFMPEHVHLLVYPQPVASGIDSLLRAIKRPYSFRIKQELEQQQSSLLQALTVRQRPGVTTFRFWQEGPGYDRNLFKLSAVMAAIDYIHLNPVRRGLVDHAADWPWSSVRFYSGESPIAPIPHLNRLPATFFEQG